MSELLDNISIEASGLEAVANAATAGLGLVPGEFAWYTAEASRPMKPQTVLRESRVLVDFYTNRATLYGGLIANAAGDFAYGHIRASVKERNPDGVMHQTSRYDPPVPYTPRILTVKDGRVTVDTPTMNPSLSGGPVVVEGMTRSPRFRETTEYDIRTGDVMFRRGQLMTAGEGWGDDQTITQDAFEFPDEITLPRLETVVRTIRAASYLFTQVAARNVSDVRFSMYVEDPSKSQ